MKKTLLEIVQQILSDLDSEEINSLSDSAEANQIAKIVEQTYYQLFSNRLVPEHEQLLKITAASDNTTPTHFTLGADVRRIDCLWYSVDSNFDYKEIYFVEPLVFLKRTDNRSENYVNVSVEGTNLRIRTDKQPDFYTSFDDETIIMDSYDSTIDTTLQESKVRALGVKHPTFTISDSFTPDIDSILFPLLIAESRSMCFETLKGGTTPKVESVARKNRQLIQNDRYRIDRENKRPDYGRK